MTRFFNILLSQGDLYSPAACGKSSGYSLIFDRIKTANKIKKQNFHYYKREISHTETIKTVPCL